MSIDKTAQNATALAAQALTQDIAEAHEAMGMLKAFNFVGKLLTVGSLKILADIKETKKYKGLVTYIDGKLLTVGSWEQYVTACGLGVKKVDEDLRNLTVFGEDFLETSQRLGLGYREMRKLRQLPDDARAEIIDADYSETADKEELLEKIEDLTARHAKEKAELETELKRKSADYDAQSLVLADKNKKINELDLKLADKELKLKAMPPERKGELLREEAGKLGYKLEAQVRSSLRGAFISLTEHSQEYGTDHKQFMAGLLAQIEVAINELYGEYGLERVHYTDYVPKWIAQSRDENEEVFEPDEFECEEV